MVFRYQHVINIYKIKTSGADIIQQCRRIAASKGIADILAAAKEAAAMEVNQGRTRRCSVSIRVSYIKIAVGKTIGIPDLGNDVLPIFLHSFHGRPKRLIEVFGIYRGCGQVLDYAYDELSMCHENQSCCHQYNQHDCHDDENRMLLSPCFFAH